MPRSWPLAGLKARRPFGHGIDKAQRFFIKDFRRTFQNGSLCNCTHSVYNKLNDYHALKLTFYGRFRIG